MGKVRTFTNRGSLLKTQQSDREERSSGLAECLEVLGSALQGTTWMTLHPQPPRSKMSARPLLEEQPPPSPPRSPRQLWPASKEKDQDGRHDGARTARSTLASVCLDSPHGRVSHVPCQPSVSLCNTYPSEEHVLVEGALYDHIGPRCLLDPRFGRNSFGTLEESGQVLDVVRTDVA